MKVKCYKCSFELDSETEFNRQDKCTQCGFDSKVCKNCIHYDLSKYNECNESIAERVVDKEHSNFCDCFKAGTNQSRTSNSARSATLAAAEALFKKK